MLYHEACAWYDQTLTIDKEDHVISHNNPALDLSGAFDQPPGYRGMCWVELSDGGLVIDRSVPAPLKAFIEEVANVVRANGMDDCRVGCAYMRVIEGSAPETYMRWHIDNQDGGVRFSTAVATDGVKVNLAWPESHDLVGCKVIDTDWRQANQPDNGVIVAFTTEPHGVLPQPVRPGELTTVFFATLYESREAADLYTTNNTTTPKHAALPTLEGDR